MVYNPFKKAVQFFKTASNFPNFDGQNVFFLPNSTGPWPGLQKGKKIPAVDLVFLACQDGDFGTYCVYIVIFQIFKPTCTAI